MKEVIRIQDKKVQDEKPVEFTHIMLVEKGWHKTGFIPTDFYKVVYLGKCNVDGDMFAGYSRLVDSICILKGHLNSGKY